MKKPKPMQKSPMQGANQKMSLLDVHPKINKPAAKSTDPAIMGGRRASGTALLPF